MTPSQQARRARNRAAKEADRLREAKHLEELAAREVERQEALIARAFQRSAPECATWYRETVDWGDMELKPSAHQIVRASIMPDEHVLAYMAANIGNSGYLDWHYGRRQDIRRAFPVGITAEQIVVKLWHMEKRGLIHANLDAGLFGLAQQEEADHG